MKRISISSPLYFVLLPLAFFGSCAVSSSVIFEWAEKKQFRPVTTIDEPGFPVLARTREGKYVTLHYGAPEGSEIVKTVSGLNVDQVNQDIREARGVHGSYPYFRVHEGTDGRSEVVLDVPSKKNEWVLRGYYVMKDGQLTPQRMLAYFGPGLMIILAPWFFAASVFGVVMFCLFFRRAKKSDQAPEVKRETVTSQG